MQLRGLCTKFVRRGWEFASHMVLRKNVAPSRRGVQGKFRREDFVGRMEQSRRIKCASSRGVSVMHRREVFVSRTVKRRRLSNAASRDVRNLFGREEFAGRIWRQG